MKHILIIVGSLRKESFNRQLAREIEKVLACRATVSYLEYGDIPFMNQDIEYPTPESVARVREDVQQADGIWIVSAEYNFNMPGFLKNLLDWLSRPLIPNDRSRNSAVKGKVVTISGAAGKSAAAGMRKNLKTLLEIMSMKVIGDMGTGISLDAEAFLTGKLELSEENQAAIEAQAIALLEAI